MNLRLVLTIIVFSQFACTSLWFAGNAVIAEISAAFNLSEGSLSYLTSSVQFGFISGTLIFALLTIADRFSPSRVFFVCAIIGAITNISILWLPNQVAFLLAARFLTGFMLAGIYPVGMKIASDYHEKGLGRALGLLVGALVLGTAFPHLVKATIGSLNWQTVIIATSALSSFGGILILLFVPNGPFRRKSAKFDLSAVTKVFKSQDFRAAAFGYFGHMWELYAFWAFVPVILTTYNAINEVTINVPVWSFVIIALGSMSCAIGGELSFKVGSGRVAFYSLLISGLCCLASVVIFGLTQFVFLSLLVIWGLTVISDSPQFSTLVAQTAPKESIGTALTIVNSLGFLISIGSIQLLGWLNTQLEPSYVYLFLFAGPVFGLLNIRKHL